MKLLTPSNEDYLEAIYVLELTKERIKSVDIASSLNVSKPGVNKAVNILKSLGYVDKADYGDVILTNLGRQKAKEIYSYHTTLNEFLLNLGVSPETAAIDCCKLEHAISEETYQAIVKFLKKNNKGSN